MALSLDLVVGVSLTVTGWFALVITVFHSRRVINRLTSQPRRSGDRSLDDDTLEADE